MSNDTKPLEVGRWYFVKSKDDEEFLPMLWDGTKWVSSRFMVASIAEADVVEYKWMPTVASMHRNRNILNNKDEMIIDLLLELELVLELMSIKPDETVELIKRVRSSMKWKLEKEGL